MGSVRGDRDNPVPYRDPELTKETRLALLKSLNEKVVTGARISPSDLVIMLYEIAGENASFGSGLAQRAHIARQG